MTWTEDRVLMEETVSDFNLHNALISSERCVPGQFNILIHLADGLDLGFFV